MSEMIPQQQINSKHNQKKKHPKYCTIQYLRFVLETIVVIGITVTIAIEIPSFLTILGLSGSLTKTLLCYVFPSLFYLMTGQTPIREDKAKWVAIFLIFAGIICGVISAVATVQYYLEVQKIRPMTNTTYGL